MLDKDTKVIQGISTVVGGEKTYINAKYWGNLEVKDVKTIGGKSIFKESESDDDNIVIHSDSILETTYFDLKTLRDKSELIQGIQYRITDYVTTTSQENTQSECHQFDIIVTADSVNTLNEVARVCLNKTDTYFKGVNLDAWEIKYCLDNDTERFAWADTVDGKGVIYYMKDEFNNEAYYDFKNIKYNISSYQSRPTGYDYVFTFTNAPTGDDLSLTQNVRNNTVKRFTDDNGLQYLNATLFICDNEIYNNILEENSSNNLIFVSSFYCNNIGREFQNNVIYANIDYSRTSVHNNIIGSLFRNNNIYTSFNRNKIGCSVSKCNFYSGFTFNNMDNDYEHVDFNYPISYCDFGSYIKYCVFSNIDSYTPSVDEMKWCVFEGGLYGGKNIPSCQRVTFQKSLNIEEYVFDLSQIKLIDGRIMSDVLTSKHNEHLCVYRDGDKFCIYKKSDEKIKTLTPLFSNPNLDLESTNNDVESYGYVGTLYNLNVFGDNVLIDSIGAYIKDNQSSPNVWCRLLKFVDGAWEIVSQSENCKSIDENYHGNLFTFKMVNKSLNPLLKNSDKIAIVYVTSEDSEILSSVKLGFKSISKPGGLTSVITNESIGELNWTPAFVFGYSSIYTGTFGFDLGEFSSIDIVSSKAAEIDVCSNKNISRLLFKINDGTGFIEQFISDGSYTVQTLYFNGEISTRKIVYTVNNDIKNIQDVSEWCKIIEHTDLSILYSKNSEVVTIGGDQIITGDKQFEGEIKLSEKTVIQSSNIDSGELKVFNANDETDGFVIRTNGKFEDTNIPQLELIGTNNIESYKYQFPQLENPNDNDEIVVKSQLDRVVEIVRENEKVTAFALNHLKEIETDFGGITNILINTTYSKLVQTRDSFGLIPGMQYRITDYVTTVSPDITDVKSAGHLFDIIVTADSENVLNEVARVCMNETDSYFLENGSNLNAWKIWYCLDNDKNRFDWVDEINGKGVIYRMIDEYGNDCPYDFKNIMYNSSIFGEYINNGVNEDDNYIYTFSWVDNNKNIKDISIIGNVDLKNEYEEIIGVYNNIIRRNCIFDNKQSLNYIVFFNTFEYSNGIFYGCYNNIFGYDCYYNEFYDNCANNTFGNNCKNNIINTFCTNNTFGNQCENNNLGDNCEENTFGNNCQSNKLNHDCSYNTFGNHCKHNEFATGCVYNNLLSGCEENILSDYCSINTFGNHCDRNILGRSNRQNIFGNDCNENSFGNNCIYITFGNNCGSNTLGSANNYITLGNNCWSNTFGNANKQNTFGNNCKYNSFEDNCLYITFGNVCNYNTFGNSNNYITFGNGCLNNSFKYCLTNGLLQGSADGVRYIHYDDCVNNVILMVNEDNIRIKNICVKQGVSNIEQIISSNQDYTLTIAKNSKNEVKIFCLADLI